MFKKKKEIKEAIPNPPKVLKELKKIRFVIVQVGHIYTDGKITLYRDQLIQETKFLNAMNELCWGNAKCLDRITDYYSEYTSRHNEYANPVREFLGID